VSGRPHITIEELLLRHRAIDEDQLARARNLQKKTGGDLGRVMVDLGFVSEELLLRAQSHQLGIPLVDPLKDPPAEELTRCLPVALAERFRVIPVGGNPAGLYLRIATSSPGDTAAVAELAKLTGFRIELAAASSKSIKKAIRRAYYGEGAPPDPPPPEELPELQPEPDLHHELQEMRKLLAAFERRLTTPEYAALMARVERLEQIAENDHHALNVLGQVLVDIGAIPREELKKRLSRG
jgi:hypothetical protein